MSDQPQEKLSDLERLLAALPPRPAVLDRDFLLYRAGQVSMRRSWLWPCAAVLMSLTAGCLGTILVLMPSPAPVVRIVHVEVPAALPVTRNELPDEAPGHLPMRPAQAERGRAPSLSYWQLQNQALRFGVDSLPYSPDGDGESGPVKPDGGAELSAGSRPSLVSNTPYFGGP